MLQLALTALLAGSLITGGLSGDDDKDKDKAKANAQQPIESIIVPDGDATLADEDDPINDTYQLGRTERIPIKLWVGYGWAEDEQAYNAEGEEFDVFGDGGSVTAQRAFVGGQINVINFTNFSVGAGGQLIAADNKIATRNPLTGDPLDLESGFGLQNAKVYGLIRGRTLGVHGGYIFDLGDEPEDIDPAAGETGNSDGVNAWFVGVDFDYPSERFRVFAGIDYFNRDEFAANITNSGAESIEDDEIVVFNAGAGLKISWIEIGAAALLRTNLAISRIQDPVLGFIGGGHQGSIAPYLRLSPPAFPVSISVKGAFLSEYADYGYSLGGAGDLVTHKGFTVTASLGF
jgi:hypothetical protein